MRRLVQVVCIVCAASVVACSTPSTHLAEGKYKEMYISRVLADLGDYSRDLRLAQHQSLDPKSKITLVIFGSYVQALGLAVQISPEMDRIDHNIACSAVLDANNISPYLESIDKSLLEFSRRGYALMKCADKQH